MCAFVLRMFRLNTINQDSKSSTSLLNDTMLNNSLIGIIICTVNVLHTKCFCNSIKELLQKSKIILNFV